MIFNTLTLRLINDIIYFWPYGNGYIMSTTLTRWYKTRTRRKAFKCHMCIPHLNYH